MTTYPRFQPAKLVLVSRGITQAEVARRIGVSRNLMCRMLNAYEPTSPRVTAGLVELLGLPADQLVDPALGHRNSIRGGRDDA